jgi:hypothetical protein
VRGSVRGFALQAHVECRALELKLRPVGENMTRKKLLYRGVHGDPGKKAAFIGNAGACFCLVPLAS